MRPRHLSVVVLAVSGLANVRPVQSGEAVPNLLGNYSGVLVSAGTGAVTHFIASYIEQDNLRRFTGELAFGVDAGPIDIIPFAGTIAASDKCTCIGSGKFVYQARWVKFGDGAGALIGQATVDYGDVVVKGTMIQFRSFSNQRRPDVRGDYGGTFQSNTTGAKDRLVARISDGTSNTLTLAIALGSGRTPTEFVAAGDVASDGRFVAVGVAPDGNVAVVEATIQDGELFGTLSIQSATGKVLDVNSIIAILIG